MADPRLPSAPAPPAPARRARRAFGILLGLLAVTFVLSPVVGSVPTPPGDLVFFLVRALEGSPVGPGGCPVPVYAGGANVPCLVVERVLLDSRLPEMFLAALVGAALALAGATLQGIFRNPLGDPYLLGVSSGAALGASALFLLGVGAALGSIYLPALAFLGAMGTAALVLLAARSPRTSTETLLLTGVALSSFFGALIALFISLRPQSALLPLTFWILGSFGGATWPQVELVLGGTLLAGTLLALHGRDLNVLQLGEETARGLGLSPPAIQRRLLLLASLVTAVAVAFNGIIGFVGLISPHVVRRLQGPDYRALLPLSALFGAIFLVLADDLAESLLGGGSLLPVGVVTSFAGAPFFLYVLYRRRRGLR